MTLFRWPLSFSLSYIKRVIKKMPTDEPFYRLLLVQIVLLVIPLNGIADDRFVQNAANGRMYLAIASSNIQAYGRAFNRTLYNLTQTYLPKENMTLDTLVINLPDNGSFSARLLETVCRQFDGKHVVAVLIVGDTPAAYTVSLAAQHSGIPVLWAKGHAGFLPGFKSLESRPLEVELAPTGRELVQALRGLLLQAHWHTFTILADSTVVSVLQRPELWTILNGQPLHPNLVPLPLPLRAQLLFRKLADISRSTRGVVILLSDRPVAIQILDEARRLNMMDGHFVWLWIDTSANLTIRNTTAEEPYDARERYEDGLRYKRDTPSNLRDLHVSYLLRNDRDLLFAPDDVAVVTSTRTKQRNGEDSMVSVGGVSDLPAGLLSLKALPVRIDRHLVKGAVRLLLVTLKNVVDTATLTVQDMRKRRPITGCWRSDQHYSNFSLMYGRELKMASGDALAGKKFKQEIGVDKLDKSLVANFEILNLVPERSPNDNNTVSPAPKWKRVGMVAGRTVRLDTIIWPGGDLSVAAVSTRPRTLFRIVTALAPPFVMESELDEDGQCLRGLPCHRVLTSDKDNLTLVLNQIHWLEEEHNEETVANNRFLPFQKFKYRTNCCYGLSMDLLENVAQELEFDFRLYIVPDGFYGSRMFMPEDKKDVTMENGKWNGIVGDLMSGAAHMSFAALSVSSARSEVIDFSVPYFFSGVSFLAAPQQKSEIPLMAFLLPFSPELWIAIFTSLNITAIAVAIYEWLSPFGLNPWGRQRSKNFSMSSALWVMWGLLCGHLVAFKAPKSWPNKFLINVWGGFSVIFVASYTANIAALIAGLFFHNRVGNYHDRSLLSQKVGASRSSAAEYYVQKANQILWQHMKKYSLENVEEGIDRLRNGSLDILIADTPILDYYRATDHGCKLQKIGDSINEDTYAIGMTKGFPLKDSISAVIAKYSSNGYMDILQEKWYGGLPCFKLANDIAQPRPLGVAAVTGVFILLGVGIVLGLVILLVEHLFFRYTLPILRDKPKGSIWRSRNIMFFSQKLYRFINCVELVSPHHAARELVHTIRQGQITSLFQKSIKRKEHEQRRRRKSKAQFFEMIQEIRRQQQEDRDPPLERVAEDESEYQSPPEEKRTKLSPSILRRTFMRTSPKTDASKRSPTSYLFSPRSKNKAQSSSSLNVRRFSTDSVFNSPTPKFDHSSAVGRRLSKDASAFLTSSPPDINSRRSSYLDIITTGNKLSGKSPVLSIENVSDCSANNERKLSDSDSIGRKLATLPKYREQVDRHRLQPQYSLTLGKSEETLNRNDESEKNNLSDGELARRNQLTNELKSRLRDNNKPNPPIRIQVEDTSKQERRKQKTRHQSLGDQPAEVGRRPRLGEQSKSLDGNPTRRAKRRGDTLPPAPPPPNCSPRNGDGRSPLERLSKDELVLLWRSSESELRSHLLKAIRDKEQPP